jgi:hypothetical protein
MHVMPKQTGGCLLFVYDLKEPTTHIFVNFIKNIASGAMLLMKVTLRRFIPRFKLSSRSGYIIKDI